jgi:hypothetical protein
MVNHFKRSPTARGGEGLDHEFASSFVAHSLIVSIRGSICLIVKNEITVRERQLLNLAFVVLKT